MYACAHAYDSGTRYVFARNRWVDGGNINAQHTADRQDPKAERGHGALQTIIDSTANFCIVTSMLYFLLMICIVSVNLEN